MGKGKATQLEFKHITVTLAQQKFVKIGHIGCSLPRSHGPSTRSGDLKNKPEKIVLKKYHVP